MIPKRKLGRTGQEVSILGFGCMRLPLTSDNIGDIDYDLADKMLTLALDHGVNYIDTAYPYHGRHGRSQPGESEVWLGQALKKIDRTTVKVATKLPLWILEKEDDLDRILDHQLQRLGLSYIDFYLAHCVTGELWPLLKKLEYDKFFDGAIKDGRIKYAGFSFHDQPKLFKEVLDSYDWSLAQIQYNYLDVNYQAGRQGLNLAHESGLATVIMEPLRGGFLIDQIPEELRSFLKGKRPDWSLADWGLRWLWQQPEAHLVLSGMTNLTQLEENIKIAEGFNVGSDYFNAADEEALAYVRKYFEEKLKVGCTGCEYCMPCPAGVNIPRNLGFFNNYFMFDSQEARTRTKYFYDVQMPQADRANKCVQCRECEERCPQHIEIATNMKETADLLC